MVASVSAEDPAAVDVAERVLRDDGVVVVPTDTVYGLAALPTSAAAVEQLYALKGRPESVPIAVLVHGAAQAAVLAEVSAEAQRLMDAFWPGPLTIVLDRLAGDGTVGVRCPDHAFVRALAGRVGPLSVTSANRHGAPTPTTADAAAGGLDGDVALIVDGGPCPGTASTVVDGTDATLPVLREGPIHREQIVAAALR